MLIRWPRPSRDTTTSIIISYFYDFSSAYRPSRKKNAAVPISFGGIRMIDELLAKIARFSPSAKFLAGKTEIVDFGFFVALLSFGLVLCFFGPRLVELLLPAIGFFGGCCLGLLLTRTMLSTVVAVYPAAKLGIILLVGLLGALAVRGLFSAFVLIFELGVIGIILYYILANTVLVGHARLPLVIGFVLAFVLLLFLNPVIVPVFVLTGRGVGALFVAVSVYHYYPSKLALLAAFGVTVVGAVIIRGIVPKLTGSSK